MIFWLFEIVKRRPLNVKAQRYWLHSKVNGQIRPLDMRLRFKDVGVCWCYEPCANKPLLPFKSAHTTKLVKRAIATMCLKNTFGKSCSHCISDVFNHQAEKLLSAGYPQHLLISVAEGLPKKMCTKLKKV